MADTLSVVGAVTGALGLSISLLVYFRDAPRVKVNVRLDMVGWGTVPNERHLVIVISNVGRRTIYLERPHMPGISSAKGAVIFAETMGHITLAEGAKPQVISILQAGLENEPGFATEWWRIRVRVWDAAGRGYWSRWITEKPSFAVAEAPPMVVVVARLLNALADFRLRLLA